MILNNKSKDRGILHHAKPYRDGWKTYRKETNYSELSQHNDPGKPYDWIVMNNYNCLLPTEFT